MKVLVFFQNVFLHLVHLILRCTAAKVFLSCVICRKVRNHHYLCTKASSLSPVRTPQAPSPGAQGLLHSRPYTGQWSSSEPGQALSSCGFVAGGRPTCTPRGLGCKSAQKAVLRWPGWSHLLAGNPQRKKEEKENCWIKSSSQIDFPTPIITFPHPEFVAVTKITKPWLQCMWEELSHCRQGLLWGLCLSGQSDRKKVLRSPPRTRLTLTKENTHN